jgi:hypothetical protein
LRRQGIQTLQDLFLADLGPRHALILLQSVPACDGDAVVSDSGVALRRTPPVTAARIPAARRSRCRPTSAGAALRGIIAAL